MIRLLIGIAMLVLPAAAMAQEAGEDDGSIIIPTTMPIPVREIVVIGAGSLKPPESDAVQSIAVLRDLDPGLGVRVENRLRDEAGIVQFRRSDGRSAHPTSQGVTLRGLGGNASSRALVTLDGVPQADPFGGWVAWSAYDAIRLGGISIARGGGSGVDGPGALAGTIGLYSEMTDGVTASAAYGSRDSFDASASAGTELGNGQVAIDGRYSRGDGFTPIRKDQRGTVDRAAPYEQGGLGVRLRFDAGDNSRIEASVRGFADRRDRGTDFTESKVDGLDASLRVVHDPAGRRSGSRSPISSCAISRAALRVSRRGGTASIRRCSSGCPRPVSAPASSCARRSATATRCVSVPTGAARPAAPRRISSSPMACPAVTASPAAAAIRSAPSPNGPRAIRTTVFLWTLSGRVDRWWLGTGYRLERNIAGPPITDLGFAPRQGWEGSGRAGLRWTSNGFSLRAAGYRGWRLPTLNELYRPFRVGAEVTTANEALEPERLWGGEVGADWSGGATKLSATLFANHLSNAIANVTLAPNLNQRQNLDAIDSKASSSPPNRASARSQLRATYAYTDAKVDAAGAAATLDGRRPAQIAKHGGSVSLRSNGDGPFGGFATLRYVGKQNEDDLGLLILGDALTLDAGLSWRFAKAISIEARGENLFDELVPAAISSAGIVERATPRTLWIGRGLTFRFAILRHCERSEAIPSLRSFRAIAGDCFVATLLAMTRN